VVAFVLHSYFSSARILPPRCIYPDQVSASADLSDPLSGDKVQASAFELLAATTLMDVETTCLAVAKRCLTDSGAL